MPDQSSSPNLNPQSPEAIKAFRDALGISDPKDKHQAHGLSVREMEDLRTQQSAGDVEMIEGNMMRGSKIKKCDAHLIHAIIENIEFDRKGKRLSVPRQQCFYIADFENMTHPDPKKSGNVFSEWEVTVIHDPRKKVAATAITGAEIKPEMATVNTTTMPLVVENLPKMNEKMMREIYANMFSKESTADDTPDMLRAIIADKLKETK